MRFHLDENVDHAIADGLRRRGIDVTTSTDVKLLGASDESQLTFATNEMRVIVTHDKDYLRLNAIDTNHSGIAYCPPKSCSLGELIQSLVLIHECLETDEMRGEVEFI